MRQWAGSLVLVAGMLAGLAMPAVAQPVTTVYSRIDDQCIERGLPDAPVVEIICQAPGDWSLILHVSDHGASITYLDGQGHRSSPLSPPARALFGSFHTVVEWREQVGSVFASIHRYHHETPAEMSGGPGEAWQTLMVTALRSGDSVPACVVAFIDASAIRDANQLARDVADRLAPGWDCALDPVWFDADLPSLNAYGARMGHH